MSPLPRFSVHIAFLPEEVRQRSSSCHVGADITGDCRHSSGECRMRGAFDRGAVGPNMEEGSRRWYRDVLLLPDKGGVPGFPGGNVKSSKADCVAAFGAPVSGGRYRFRGRGSTAYELYTLELLERTHQQTVDHVTSLPCHFARGLLDEESGERVNWTLFAVRRQELHRRWKSTSSYLLPKYKDLEKPIPFVHPRCPLGDRQPPDDVNITRQVRYLECDAYFLFPQC